MKRYYIDLDDSLRRSAKTPIWLSIGTARSERSVESDPSEGIAPRPHAAPNSRAHPVRGERDPSDFPKI